MGIVIRQSLKSSAVTIMGALLGAAFNFMASRLLPAVGLVIFAVPYFP